jgi:hypothetical protein
MPPQGVANERMRGKLDTLTAPSEARQDGLGKDAIGAG